MISPTGFRQRGVQADLRKTAQLGRARQMVPSPFRPVEWNHAAGIDIVVSRPLGVCDIAAEVCWRLGKDLHVDASKHAVVRAHRRAVGWFPRVTLSSP